MGGEIGQHRLNDSGINRGSRIIIKIDRTILQTWMRAHNFTSLVFIKSLEAAGFNYTVFTLNSAARPDLSSSHTLFTSCSVVRRLPMAIRMVYLPCSLVCERK